MKKKIFIAVGVLLLILLCLFLILNNKSKKDNKEDNNKKEVEKVTIKFDADGGDEVEDLVIDKGAQVLLPSTSKEGYYLEGWYLNDEKILSTHVYNEDITVKAKWEKIEEDAKTYKISFDSKGGSKVKAITVLCDKEVKLPSPPAKEGYTFVSWEFKNGKSLLDGALLSCEDVTVYAVWEKKEEEKKTVKEEKKEYTCPEGYSLDGTKCKIEKDPTLGCDKQTEGKYNEKCYTLASFKEATCKVFAGSTTPGNPILLDGKVINSGSVIHCAAESMPLTNCVINGGTVLNGSSCYKYVQTITKERACSDFSGYEYIVGNALYDTSIGRTNVKTGCYTSVALHNICDSDYTLVNNKCVKTVDATLN